MIEVNGPATVTWDRPGEVRQVFRFLAVTERVSVRDRVHVPLSDEEQAAVNAQIEAAAEGLA